jgi:hypothetical protein
MRGKALQTWNRSREIRIQAANEESSHEKVAFTSPSGGYQFAKLQSSRPAASLRLAKLEPIMDTLFPEPVADV